MLGVLPVRAVTLPLLPGDGTLHGEEKLAVVVVARPVIRALRCAHEPRVTALECVPQFGLRETLLTRDAILEGDDDPGRLAVLARLDDPTKLPIPPVLRARDVLLYHRRGELDARVLGPLLDGALLLVQRDRDLLLLALPDVRHKRLRSVGWTHAILLSAPRGLPTRRALSVRSIFAIPSTPC